MLCSRELQRLLVDFCTSVVKINYEIGSRLYLQGLHRPIA